MQPDRLNWLNQTVRLVSEGLRNNKHFMAGTSLAGGTGVVQRVDEHVLDHDTMGKPGLPYCAVTYLSHDRASFDGAIGQRQFDLEVLVHLTARLPGEAKPAEHQAMWASLCRAAAVIPVVVAEEMGPDGDQFDNLATLAEVMGGNASLEEEDGELYGAIRTGIRLSVTIVM